MTEQIVETVLDETKLEKYYIVDWSGNIVKGILLVISGSCYVIRSGQEIIIKNKKECYATLQEAKCEALRILANNQDTINKRIQQILTMKEE